jgi:hypothetical protein
MPSTLSQPFTIRVPHAQLVQLKQLAALQGLTPGAIATEALGIGLERLLETHLQRQQPGERKHRDRDKSAPDQAQKAAAAEPEFSVYKPFAQAVLDCARRCKTGQFADDRIFIGHAWRQYTRDLGIKMSLESFKDKLLEANRERHLSLVRADMAPVLDQADVQESETRYLSATFHFLCL